MSFHLELIDITFILHSIVTLEHRFFWSVSMICESRTSAAHFCQSRFHSAVWDVKLTLPLSPFFFSAFWYSQGQNANEPHPYASIVRTAASIFWNEGITAFWKGVVPTTLGTAAEDAAMTFGVNEALKWAFPDDLLINTNGRPDLWKLFLMGGLTGCCLAVQVLSPSAIFMAKSQVVVGSHNSD